MAKQNPKNQNKASEENQQPEQKKVGSTWMKMTMIAGFGLVSLVFLVVVTLNTSPPVEAKEKVVVYKSPSCGCCSKWVDHMEDMGFAVEVHDRKNMDPIKREYGIQPKHQSCHTAKVGGYVIEGHVPAADIKRLLVEKPDIKGLAAPGMPMGSPGMEGPHKDAYDVLALDHDDSAQVFSHH